VSTGNVVGKVGKFNLSFRHTTLSSHAGMVLVKEFADALGVAQIINDELGVKARQRGYTEAEAVMGLVYNVVAGGESLSDLDVLRGDPGTKELLGVEQIIAPTTAGEHLRKFSIGDLRDLQRTNSHLQQQVRPHQEQKTVTMDLDSSVYEQSSEKKQGSNKAYNGEIGYHPLFAFWEEEGELIHSHLRRGSAYTASKVVWFMQEVLKRVPQQAAKKVRADSGFYSREVVGFCEKKDVSFGITADQTAPLMKLVSGLAERKWQDLERYGVAQVAELRYQPVGWKKSYRYVVKRNLMENKKGELYFRYHVLVTNDEQRSAEAVLIWHLQHANMENRIKEHKSGFGLEKMPTQRFHANWAYLLIGQIAFNLMAWFKKMVLPEQYHQSTIKTIRHQILNVAGKIVHSGRKFYLVISDQYCYQEVWKHAIKKLAALNPA
jgi:DDE family transposase